MQRVCVQMSIIKTVIIISCLLALPGVSSAADRVYTLQDAYAAALASNERVRIAREDVVQAESRIEQAFSYIYPRISGQAGYTRYNEVLPPSNSFVFQPLDEFRAGIVLTQPLYTGGRTLAAYRMAKVMREQSVYSLNSVRQQTLMDVSEAYYTVLRAMRIVEVSRESLNRMERHRAVTEKEASTRRTKANMSALLRANTLVSQASIALTRAEDGLRIARMRLSFLTGLPTDAVISEPGPLDSPADGFDRLKEIAYENRDDYRAARMNERIASENITIVKGGHYPQAALEGAVRYLDSDPETMMDGTTYYGGIRLQVPIFEGGLMKAEVSEARSRLRQAELSSELLRRSIETEVYESWVGLATTSSVLIASKTQLDDARRNFQNVESLFAEGLASSLSLIDAQQALLAAEIEYVNALYDRDIAVLRLQKAVGIIGKTDIAVASSTSSW